MNEYDGKQIVGIDLHRQRSVIVRQTGEGEHLSEVRIVNDPVALALQIEKAGRNPEVVLAATYGWYWAADTLQAAGANVHLAHPLGVKGFRYRRVNFPVRDGLIDLAAIKRREEQGVTDMFVSFRNSYSLDQNTQSLSEKVDNIVRFSDKVISRLDVVS